MIAGPSTLIGLRLRYNGPLVFSDETLRDVWAEANEAVRKELNLTILYPSRSSVHREAVYQRALSILQTIEKERTNV